MRRVTRSDGMRTLTSIEEMFPRINLVREQALVVSVFCTFQWDDEVASLFDEILEEDRFISLRKYRAGKTDHVLTEFTSRFREGEGGSDDLAVRIEYNIAAVPDGSVPRELRREGQLLPRLATLPEPATLECHADFSFEIDEGAVGSMWFPLPTSIPPVRGVELPVDEIRGIRGVKRRGEEDTEYSFILDRPRNGPLFLSVDFQLRGRLSAHTLVEVLDHAKNVAKGLGVV